jgi:MFS family permease
MSVATFGSAMVFVDGHGVHVALAVIQRELKASFTSMQWIVEVYSLLLASLVLLSFSNRWSGAVAERHGASLLLSIGPFLAACGFSLPALPELDASYVRRILAGMGMTVLQVWSVSVRS